tara:strand:+ start:123 stop:1778 length:1656 start_codon:yes stop_codon:yes gene_type:complete
MKIREMFKGNEDAYGTYIDTGEKDAKGKVKTKNTTLSIENNTWEDLWEKHLKGEKSLGVIPINQEHNCKWGCIDIDSYDNFSHLDLLRKIKKAEFPFIVCKSKSAGAHVYCFFKNYVKAKDLKEKLTKIAAALGHKGAEVFPKQSTLQAGFFGNYVNMPYFNAEKTTRCALKLVDDQVKELNLEEFYDYYDDIVIESIKDLSEGTDAIWSDGPPCNNCIAINGCSENRNLWLYNVAAYLNKKDRDTNECKGSWAAELQEINKQYCPDPLGEAEVARIHSSVFKSNWEEIKDEEGNQVTDDKGNPVLKLKGPYKYKCSESPMKEHCMKYDCGFRKYGVKASTDDGNENYEIESIQKVEDDPVHYYVTFKNGQTMGATSQQMSDQTAWRTKVFETLDYKPGRLSEAKFTENLNHFLAEKLSYMKPPEGITKIDRIREHMGKWFRSIGKGEDSEAVVLGESYHDAKTNLIHFKFEDLFIYLMNRKIFKDDQNARTAFSKLLQNPIDEKGFGAESGTFRINKNKTTFAWNVSAEQFNLKKEIVEPEGFKEEKSAI